MSIFQIKQKGPQTVANVAQKPSMEMWVLTIYLYLHNIIHIEVYPAVPQLAGRGMHSLLPAQEEFHLQFSIFIGVQVVPIFV